MVRKRSYKKESDDSDSDYTPDMEDSQPKRYSLRKRTRQTFCEEFDYDVDDSDLSPRQHLSEDDDFEVDATNDQYVSYAQPHVIEGATVSDSTQVNNGLIDFEDIIRADIVINKNRIDYDNVINKTEIKIEKRRGRPPKRKPELEGFGTMTHSILGPLADVENYLAPLLEPVTQVESVLETEEQNEDCIQPQVEAVLETSMHVETALEPVTNVDEKVPSSPGENNTLNGNLETPNAQLGSEKNELQDKSMSVTEDLTNGDSEVEETSAVKESAELTQNLANGDSEVEETSTIKESVELTQDSTNGDSDVEEISTIKGSVELSHETSNGEVLSKSDDSKTDEVIILDDKPDVIVLDD